MTDKNMTFGIVGCGRVTETATCRRCDLSKVPEFVALADIDVDRLNHVERRCMRIDCYRFNGLEETSSFEHPGGIHSRLPNIRDTLKDLPFALLKLRHGGGFVDSYRAEWRHFIDAIGRYAGGTDACRRAQRASSRFSRG